MYRFTTRCGLVVLMLALSVATVSAAPVAFSATFSGANESPVNASPGTGSTLVIFDTVADTLEVNADFSGLMGTTTAAHIHCCAAPGGNAGVATVTPSFTGFPLGVMSGIYSHTFDTSLASTFSAGFIAANGGTPAGAEAALFAGMLAGQSYFNIHTTVFPGGEIRGNLVAAPEPATLLLLGAGVAGLAHRVWRNRRSR